MTTRTTHQTVTFARPFVVPGLDGAQPAGTYTVETDDELIQALSVPAYRRLETRIRLSSAGFEQVARIDPTQDPTERDAALASTRGGARSSRLSASSSASSASR